MEPDTNSLNVKLTYQDIEGGWEKQGGWKGERGERGSGEGRGGGGSRGEK